MFKPFNKKVGQVTNIERRDICEEVMKYGRHAKKSTVLEIEIVWTTGHWTGPNDWIYPTEIAHYITDTC